MAVYDNKDRQSTDQEVIGFCGRWDWQ
uniref:Uncharacterized protein n=1 Tax=Anguilla anguilla TaxID=7936 RepID=A0A0E9W4U3_ANGAN